ncbi:UNVERIFIED_CONTAM: Poly [ADP-ribose] polymerase 2 [Sesamum radiatum]|uniref:Poly [ADP-ribose] polymerase n=1 Tax=Sesamum radiatum TaxID=300843 RepID=A0AAW2UVI1_SESRA
MGPTLHKQAAISEFEKKFYDKTKNHWSNRNEFVSRPKSYTWLEMDYSETKNERQFKKSAIYSRLKPQESKLEARIAKFISLICNMSMMRQQMMEIGYNAEKLPLGKLSKSTILKGYDVLKRIADVIGQADKKTLEQLSGEFYTVIPHDFGFRKTNTLRSARLSVLEVPQYWSLVEALGEIEVAMKLIEDDTDMKDPLYSHYRRLHCELLPLEAHSKNFHGLRIAPPEAPATGYMFGKGVYFADMFSKSANYCCVTKASTAGVLLLCEVALGDMAELLTANYDADKLPAGKLSTKGVGATAPDLSEALTLEDGVVVPLGTPKEQPGPKGSLLYNEYIVYNVEQIRMRYLVQVYFKYKSS